MIDGAPNAHVNGNCRSIGLSLFLDMLYVNDGGTK